jgi:hypothetical protein
MGNKLAMNLLSKLAPALAVAGLLACEPALHAAVATNPPSTFGGPRPVAKAPTKAPTNAPAMRPSGTNVNAVTKAAATNQTAVSPGFGAKVSDALKGISRFPSSPAFVPVVAVLIAALIAVLLLKRSKEKGKVQGADTVAVRKAPKQVSTASATSCNVLEILPEARRVWQFEARSGGFAFRHQDSTASGDKLPSGLVAKDWRNLVRPRLNIAWLPADQVFLRVIHLPKSSFDETYSMVELQLEKLSPSPVAQVVWSLQVLPHAQDNMQTVIVMIVARAVVEEFLGNLEGQGYLADRLDLPLLDQLQATPIVDDGAWIYPTEAGKASALVAWWFGGVLQNLDLLHLAGEDRVASVREQILQMTWAGELEGWIAGQPHWHLVADNTVAPEWEPVLKQALEQPIEREQSMAVKDLAAMTARRAVQAPAQGNLLPPEYSERYRNQFIDRLWMGAVGSVIGVYIIGVLVYFLALYVLTMQKDSLQERVADLGGSYTNALQLEARFKVLSERQELKFAALDCWTTVAKLIPGDVVLDSLAFNDGKRLDLRGSAPAAKQGDLIDFYSAMRKARINNEPLFDDGGDGLNYGVAPGNTTMLNWRFGLILRRGEK